MRLDPDSPNFNTTHILDPSGDEPLEERWLAWNDLSFDIGDYLTTYFFWLGAPDNDFLTEKLGNAEYLISWSTARELRRTVIQDKGFGHAAKYPKDLTLRDATEVGFRSMSFPGKGIRLVDTQPRTWDPPAQIHLVQPPIVRYTGNVPFSTRLKEYKERRKLEQRNKPRRTKPRIAARRR